MRSAGDMLVEVFEAVLMVGVPFGMGLVAGCTVRRWRWSLATTGAVLLGGLGMADPLWVMLRDLQETCEAQPEIACGIGAGWLVIFTGMGLAGAALIAVGILAGTTGSAFAGTPVDAAIRGSVGRVVGAVADRTRRRRREALVNLPDAASALFDRAREYHDARQRHERETGVWSHRHAVIVPPRIAADQERTLLAVSTLSSRASDGRVRTAADRVAAASVRILDAATPEDGGRAVAALWDTVTALTARVGEALREHAEATTGDEAWATDAGAQSGARRCPACGFTTPAQAVRCTCCRRELPSVGVAEPA